MYWVVGTQRYLSFSFYKCVLSKDSPCFKMQISNKIKHSYKLFCFWLPATGDQIPSSGDKLLPLPVLFLPDKSSESAFYVWPPQLPSPEQWHWPGWLPFLPCFYSVIFHGDLFLVGELFERSTIFFCFCRNAGLHATGCGCSFLYWQQWAGIGPPRAGSGNGKTHLTCPKQS